MRVNATNPRTATSWQTSSRAAPHGPATAASHRRRLGTGTKPTKRRRCESDMRTLPLGLLGVVALSLAPPFAVAEEAFLAQHAADCQAASEQVPRPPARKRGCSGWRDARGDARGDTWRDGLRTAASSRD
jgi:hypothetical protein